MQSVLLLQCGILRRDAPDIQLSKKPDIRPNMYCSYRYVFFINRGQQLSDNGKRQCAVVTVGTVLFITKNKNDFVKGVKMYSIFVDKNKLL